MAYIQLQLRRGSGAEWSAANSVLANGEIGINTDSSQFKIGNGTSGWNELAYASGGGGSTGDVTFENNIVIGTGDEWGSNGLYLAPGPLQAANQQILRIRGGDDLAHIHMDTGNAGLYDQYWGDDLKYVKLERGYPNGNVIIGTYDGGPKNWIFHSDGNTTFPNTAYQTIHLGENSSIRYINDQILQQSGNGDPDTFYTITDQQRNYWETYTQTDVTGGNSAWSWIQSETADANNPYVLIETKKLDESSKTWLFNANGVLSFPIDTTNNFPINQQRWGMGNLVSFLDGQWTLAEYNGTSLGTQGIRINPGVEGPSDIYLPADGDAANGTPLTIANYTANGNIEIRSNISTWRFDQFGRVVFPLVNTPRGDVSGGSVYGYTLNIGDGVHEAVITTPDGSQNNPTSQRLVINPGKGADGTGAEGGDIYLWAGRGGDTNGNGGDIKIRGGYGPGDGSGGYIRMEGGDVQGSGTPGYVYIKGGDVNIGEGGYLNFVGGTSGGGNGGYIQLTGGSGTVQGGNVQITGGFSSQGTSHYGNINIISGSSQWQFKNDGMLTFPNGGKLNVKAIAPVHSTGAAGDKAGMVAFDGDYFYHCISDYEAQTYTVMHAIAQGTSADGVNNGYLVENIYQLPQVGWKVYYNGEERTINQVNNGGIPGFYVVFIDAPPLVIPGQATFEWGPPVASDIWVRVAWTGGSW